MVLSIIPCKKENNVSPLSQNTFLKTDTFIENGDTILMNEDTVISNGDTTIIEDSVTFSYEFYLDEVEVTEGTFSITDPNLNFCLVGKDDKDGDPSTHILQIHAFNTLQGYYDFGDAHDKPLELIDEMADHLYDYAATNGYFEDLEEGGEEGEINQAFLDYQADYVLDANKSIYQQKGLFTIIHRNVNGGPDLITLPITGSPFFFFGWHDNISAYSPLIIGGLNIMYDRWRYRERIFSEWDTYGLRIRFQGPLAGWNDIASSWWSFGF